MISAIFSEINENITNSESGGKHSLPDLPLLVPITQSSPEKRVRCPIEDCNQYFVSFRAMYSHVRSGHPAYAKDNWSACPFCEKLFPQKDIIGNHFQRCKFMKFHTFSTSACPQLMICSQCKTGTVSFKHMYTVHKEFVEDNWMKCGACETYFPDMEYLSKHWNVCEASNIPQVKLKNYDHEKIFREIEKLTFFIPDFFPIFFFFYLHKCN